MYRKCQVLADKEPKNNIVSTEGLGPLYGKPCARKSAALVDRLIWNEISFLPATCITLPMVTRDIAQQSPLNRLAGVYITLYTVHCVDTLHTGTEHCTSL